MESYYILNPIEPPPGLNSELFGLLPSSNFNPLIAASTLLPRHFTEITNSVSAAKLGLVSEDDFNMFKKGIAASADSSVLHNIFSVRTNELFEVLDKHQNSIYLSGLLIGAELRCLLNEEKLPIILCSGSNLHKFYKLGLDELGFMNRTTILSNKIIDKAAILGQSLLRKAIFKNSK